MELKIPNNTQASNWPPMFSFFNDLFPNSSEEPGQPGARQGPWEEIEARHEDSLQAEDAVGVEEDWVQPEIVQFVDCCQDKLLINIKSKERKYALGIRKEKLPFKHVDRICWFSEIILFKLEKSLLETWSLNQLFVVGIIQSLLGPERDLSLHLLQRNIESWRRLWWWPDHDLGESHVVLVDLI